MTVAEKLSASLEDYLEAIQHIASEKGASKAKDIALRLKVRSSSVTGALHALAKRGLVNYAPYDLITLTPEGEKLALDVIHRHEALREFFIVVLYINETEADDIACKMEHSVSPEILERLIQFVKFMRTCPLGGAEWIEGKGFFCEHKDSEGGCPLYREEKQNSSKER